MLKKLTALLVLVALVIPAANFATAQDESLVFTMWIATDHPAVVNVFVPLAEEYKAQTGVSVEFVFLPYAEYDAQLATRLSGNNPPDAGWVVERYGPAYIDAGVLYDLAPVLKGDPEYDYADFSEPPSAQWVVGDAVYGVPFSTSPFITIFNADLFAAAGLDTPNVMAANGEWTWDALRDAAKTIADETDAWGFVGNDGGASMYSPAPWGTVIPALRAYGADIIANNECVLNSDEGVAAMQLLHDMIFADRSTVPPGDETLFWPGNVGITFGQISRLSLLDDAEFAWGIAPMPSGPAGFKPIIGQAAIAVFDGANNEKQEIAADFVRFLTTKDGVTLMTQFFPPARLSVLASDEFLTTNARVSAEDMENIIAVAIAEGTVLTSHPRFLEIELTGGAVLDLMWQPDADMAASADLYCQTISQYLGD
jgi:multiple sugar transport system substrate-binding protein